MRENQGWRFESSAWGLEVPFLTSAPTEEKWIDIDLSKQELVAREGILPVNAVSVSTGVARFPTVTGTYRIYVKYESQTMDGRRLGFDYVTRNVKWDMFFYEHYAIHGAWWHEDFGQPMSHGCVNLSNPDAKWVFHWAPVGTLVKVHD